MLIFAVFISILNIFISPVRQHTTIHKLQNYRAETHIQDDTKEKIKNKKK